MGRPTSPAKKKARKEAILEGLAAGESLAKACKAADCPESTCHRYRQLDSDFAEEVSRLLASPEHVARIAESQGAAPDEYSSKEKFLFYYEGSKDRVHACNRSGVSPIELDSYLEQQSDEFDPDFADAFRILVRSNEMKLEDLAIRKALVGRESSMVRFLLGGTKGTTVNVTGGDVHFSTVAEDNARAKLNEKFGNNAANKST